MTCCRILAGSTERIQTWPLKSASLVLLTGLTDVLLAIQRVSDNQWYDFNDATFKAAGWTTRQQVMTEVSATLAAGEYRYDWNTASITNPTADDTYMVQVTQTAATAKNMPMVGEIKVDQWVADVVDDLNNIQTRLPAALVGGRMDADVGNMQTGTVDADALATDAVNEIRDAILSDSTPFAGADIAAILADTAAIDGRLPSDPADESLQQASHTATQAAIAALNDLSQADVQSAMTAQGYTAARAAYLDELAAVNMPADLDAVLLDTAAIDGRLPSDPADESLQQAAHGVTQAAIAALNDLSISDVQTALTNQGYTAARAPKLDNLDVAVSTRSDFDETTNPVELLDSGGVAGTSAAELVVDIEAQLSGTHGAGSWEGATAAAIDAQLSGTHGAGSWATATGFAVPGDAMTLTVGERAAIDAALSAVHGVGSWEGDSAATIDVLLTTNHGVGSWQTGGAGLTQQQVRDAMKLAPTGGAPVAGSVDQHLDDIETDTSAINGRLPSDPADESSQQASHTATQAAISALNNLSIAGVQTALTNQGYTAARAPKLDNLDVAVSTRSDFDEATNPVELKDSGGAAGTSAAELVADIEVQLSGTHGASSWEGATAAAIDALLSSTHGAGSWATATGFAVPGSNMNLTPAAVDLIWDELRGGARPVGSFGYYLDALVSAGGSPTSIATAVWGAALPGAYGAGTAGYILGTNLDTALAAAVTSIIAEINANEVKLNTIISTGGTGPWTTATGFATPAHLAALQSHGDATWATAVGFATPTNVTDARDAVIAHGDLAWVTATGFSVPLDVTNARDAILAQGGPGPWTTAVVSGLATSAQLAALEAHGDLTWATAVGFSTPADLAALQSALEAYGDANWVTAVGFSTPADVAAVPAGVWAYNISGNANKFTQAGGMLNVNRKAVTNRYVLTPNITTGLFVLYDDNDSSAVLQHNINDAVGGGVASPFLSPARRSKSA